ncbi:MAG: DNA-processing protein DprA [Lachnospiraceae bacterium]
MKKYYYWLHRIEGIGNQTISKLLNYFGTPQNVYEASEQELLKLLSVKQRSYFYRSKQEDIQKEYKELEQKEITLHYIGEKEYPNRLLTIPDPPCILYKKGHLPKEYQKTVGIIGARNCSQYGRVVATKMGELLARNEIIVVSGMAKGIDGIAQAQALKEGGKTIGVLGSGVDVCYPTENRRLFDIIPNQGCLLSEYPPGTAPLAYHFPIRNRIISGLSDCLIVVEAKEKSGTSITVDMALEQGKEVFVIPGRITDPISKGCNELIKQGARIITSMEDVLEYLKEEKQEVLFTTKQEIIREEKEKKLLEILDYYPKSMEQIYEEISNEISDISLQECYLVLVQMNVKGICKILSEGVRLV